VLIHSINIALLPGFIFSLHPNNFVKPLFPFTNDAEKIIILLKEAYLD